MADRSSISVFKKADAEGFLEKYSSGITSRFLGSTRIWCELHGSTLFFFKDSKGLKVKKGRASALPQVDMSITQSVRKVAGDKSGTQFEIMFKNKSHIFAASNTEECNNWIKTLQQAMMLKDQQQDDKMSIEQDSSIPVLHDYETIEVPASAELADGPVQMRKSVSSEAGYVDIESLQGTLSKTHELPCKAIIELDEDKVLHGEADLSSCISVDTNVMQQDKEQKKSESEIHICQQGDEDTIYASIDEKTMSMCQKEEARLEIQHPLDNNKEVSEPDYETVDCALGDGEPASVTQLLQVEERDRSEPKDVSQRGSEEYGYAAIGGNAPSVILEREVEERSNDDHLEAGTKECGYTSVRKKSERGIHQEEAENVKDNREMTRTEADGIEDSSIHYAIIGAFAQNPIHSCGASPELHISASDVTSDSDGSRTPGDGADSISSDEIDADDLFMSVSSLPSPIPDLPHPLTPADTEPLKELQEFLSNNRHVCRPSTYDTSVTTDPVVDMKKFLQELAGI